MGETYGTLILFGGLLLVFLTICWLIVPLILLRQNSHLKRQLDEQRRTNELLRALSAQLPAPRAARSDAVMPTRREPTVR